jgi:nucleotidyltransferase substrate binding protein (TIGR01987 family)
MKQTGEYEFQVKLLSNALLRLNEALQVDAVTMPIAIDATIQRFEFTIELFWKALKKKLLQDHGIETQSPKSVLQQSYVNNIIHQESIWLAMLLDRNLTSHSYNRELALEIYQNILKYEPFLKTEFDRIFIDIKK